jgi:hypothetical protein
MPSRVVLRISALLVLLFFGCARVPDPQYDKSSRQPVSAPGALNNFSELTSGPYKVTTRSDVSLSSWIRDNRSEISFSGKKLVIDFDKEKLLLDDTSETKLPAGTKHVEIQIAGGKLSIKADGADVPSPQPTK